MKNIPFGISKSDMLKLSGFKEIGMNAMHTEGHWIPIEGNTLKPISKILSTNFPNVKDKETKYLFLNYGKYQVTSKRIHQILCLL